MEKWKRKNLSNIKTTNSDSEVDIPPDPIEEFNETFRTCSLPMKNHVKP
jgi:hypothetical protein